MSPETPRQASRKEEATQILIAQGLAALDRIDAIIHTLCQEGPRAWRMSIPARPELDTDLVMSAAIEQARVALKAVDSRLPDAAEHCGFLCTES